MPHYFKFVLNLYEYNIERIQVRPIQMDPKLITMDQRFSNYRNDLNDVICFYLIFNLNIAINITF